ncbi:urocortin [Rhineura floridana]|uniref:urocortin n=1 Tax=Rhineura floridana TaxID=261503 RepID=UPI002AC877DE|nr:urocortin [Rhineura floridana]
MRRAALPILVASLLLAARVSLGVRAAPGLDGGAESGLSLRLLRLGEDRAPPAAAPWPFPAPLPAPGPDVAALLVRSLHRPCPEGELRRRLGERLKRRDPPLSIDLTFHLLRQMMEISRAQSQQTQAQQNRLLFDSVGK